MMDRGIPTEEILEEMRQSDPPVLYGTPKGRLSRMKGRLAEIPWKEVRPKVRVKLMPEAGEL